MKNYLAKFPENIQIKFEEISTNISKSLIENNIKYFKIHSVELYKIYLEMFEFAWSDDELIDDAWYLWTWRFFCYPNDMYEPSNNLAKELLSYFGDLDLPIQYRSIQDTPLLIKELRKTLQAMIDILENNDIVN